MGRCEGIGGLGGVRVGEKIFADAARCEAVWGSLTYSHPLVHFQCTDIHIWIISSTYKGFKVLKSLKPWKVFASFYMFRNYEWLTILFWPSGADYDLMWSGWNLLMRICLHLSERICGPYLSCICVHLSTHTAWEKRQGPLHRGHTVVWWWLPK